MRVLKVLPQNFAANSYILTADGKTAVAIDPSEERFLSVLEQNGLECKYALLTHGHFDHVGACGLLFKKGCRICCNEREKDLIFSKEYLNMFGGVEVPEFEIFRTFSDGEEFSLCGINFKAIATPGHSAGCVSYLTDGALFCGDTLFKASIGRTDLPTGNYKELLQSLKKLSSLDGNLKLYCGHGDDSVLSYEIKTNPYFRIDLC